MVSVPSLACATLVAYRSGELKDMVLKQACREIDIEIEPDDTDDKIRSAVARSLDRPEIKAMMDEMIKKMTGVGSVPELKPEQKDPVVKEVATSLEQLTSDAVEEATAKVDIVKTAKLAILKSMGRVIAENEIDEVLESYWPTKAKEENERDKQIRQLIDALAKTIRGVQG